MIILNRYNCIFVLLLMMALCGCTERGAGRESKQDSYAELARLLGTTVSTSIKSGTTTVEYCPDNTCESFSMPSKNPTEKLNDFVYLYLYAVSDYRVLDSFRKKVEPLQVTKIIQRNSQEGKNNQLQSVHDVIEMLAEKYAIKAKFVRYDEYKKNEVNIDIKARLQRLKK